MADVVVLGGGLAGLAAAWRLSMAGRAVALVERQPTLGGLAGSFEREGRVYPLGYHQILEGDLSLRRILAVLGLEGRIHWRRMHMAFSVDDRQYRLDDPKDLLHFPLPLLSKLGLARLVATALYTPPDPRESEEDAAAWVERLAGRRAREDFFDRLCRLKYGLPSGELSAAWLRERLVGREGAGRFGAIPHTDWTRELVRALTEALLARGVTLHVGNGVVGLRRGRGGALTRVELEGGQTLHPEIVVNTLPPPVFLDLLPDYEGTSLRQIHYSGMVSCVVATRQDVPLPCYWTNFLRPYRSFGGIFRLDLLNPTLGRPGEHLVNFATHVGERVGSLLELPPEAIVERHLRDFRAALGVHLEPSWVHVSRIPYYSPIFVKGYRNPSPRSHHVPNLYFAGNFITCPTLASTGTAMASGWDTAGLVLGEGGVGQGGAAGGLSP